jgi:hypothetical protein
MSHIIIYTSELHVVESRVQGELTLDEVKEIITEIAILAKEKACHLILSDFRETTLRLSMLQLYELPKITANLFASLGLNILRCKRALVAAEGLHDYSFYENVMVNRGQKVRVFTNMDKAKKWLFGK